MNKLLVAVALAFVATSTGCFTAAGAMIGSEVKRHEVRRAPDGSLVETNSDNIAAGAVVGLALDAVTVLAISASMSDACGYPGPGEGMGGC